MAQADLATKIAYRQLIYSEPVQAIAYILKCSEEAAKNKLTALYSPEMLLAFADAGADTRTPIKHVIAYLFFTGSHRELGKITGASRLFSKDARNKYRDHKRMLEAGMKLMATYAPSPADQEIYKLFLTVVQAYHFEHAGRAMGLR